MPAADALIIRDGPVAAPLNYDVPAAAAIIPMCIAAVVDGTSAAGSFVPVLELLTPDGHVAAECPLGQALAAGGSARVTWFPGAGELNAQTAAGFPTYETLYLDTATGAFLQAATVFQTGVQYLVSIQGTYSAWNEVLNVGTPEADAMFPGSAVSRVSTMVGLDPEVMFAWPSDHPHTGGHDVDLQIDLGSGYQHREPFDGAHQTPAPDHFYSYQLVGQGVAPKFHLFDSSSDNYGKLKIVIYAIAGGGGVPGGAAGGDLQGNYPGPTVRDVSILTTKGDMLVRPTAAPAVRLPVGADGQVLTADSTQANGVKWAAGGGGGGTISSITSTGSSITVTSPAGPTTNVEVNVVDGGSA